MSKAFRSSLNGILRAAGETGSENSGLGGLGVSRVRVTPRAAARFQVPRRPGRDREERGTMQHERSGLAALGGMLGLWGLAILAIVVWALTHAGGPRLW